MTAVLPNEEKTKKYAEILYRTLPPFLKERVLGLSRDKKMSSVQEQYDLNAVLAARRAVELQKRYHSAQELMNYRSEVVQQAVDNPNQRRKQAVERYAATLALSYQEFLDSQNRSRFSAFWNSLRGK